MSICDNGEQAQSKLGEKLLTGVRNLWKEVNSLRNRAGVHDKILKVHSTDLEALKGRVVVLEQQAKSLKISKGMAKAKGEKLAVALSESNKKISEIKQMLN